MIANGVLEFGFLRRATWRNAGTASYAITLGAKTAPLNARHFALGFVELR